MTPYQTSYSIRYQLQPISQQIEAATMAAAVAIQAEDPSTANHADRLAWANWAATNSSAAWIPFGWPVAMNPTIMTAVGADPTGATVADPDVEFVVNSNLPTVIANFTANPPTGIKIPTS